MKFNNETIRIAVREWIEDENKAKEKYGDINDWDTSEVTDMSKLFSDANDFNSPIGSWNVSNVEDMKFMFSNAHNFNQNINNWDVKSVKSMHCMFFFANSFNNDINEWNVSNVSSMYKMFFHAESFNHPLNKWNVKNVTNMEGMFRLAKSFKQDISNWNVNSVISFENFMGKLSLKDNKLVPNFFSKQKTNSQMEIQRFYFDTGELECEQEVDSNGILNGFVRYYHKNGNLQTEVFWKDGKQLDGQVDSYDEEGNLVRSVYIKNGTQNGEFEEYYPNKKIKRKGFYKNGVIVEEILFDNNGNKTIIQLYNKVFSNSEFKQKLNEFKRKNNDMCSFEGITLDLNKWGLYKKGYILGSFQGHNFIKTSEIGVKWAIDDEYWDEICSYDEGEFLDFIGNEELNQFFLESEDFESGEVTSVIWNEGVPKDVVNKSRENSFFHNPWFLYYGNPCEPDHPIYELESDTIRTPGKDTIVNSVVLKLRGENYNSTLEWCFSIDKVSESAERVSKSQSNKLIKDGFIGILTKLIIKVTDSEGIDDLLKNVKVKGNSLIKEFEKNSEQLIISFNVLMEMFYDIRLATESVGDIYDLIGSENKDISEIRFQLFTEMRVNFSIDKLFNGCLCVLIILFYSSLTENQKNEIETEKIRDIEMLKSLMSKL